MTASLFGQSFDLNELNSAPHNSCETYLRAPLLSWHLAFWVSQPAEGPLTRERRRRLDDGVDRMLTDFYSHLRLREGEGEIKCLAISSVIEDRLILFNNVLDFPNFLSPLNYVDLYDENDHSTGRNNLNPAQKDLFESPFRAIEMSFEWRRSTIRVRAELDTEYFQLSFFAELFKTNDKIVKICSLARQRGHLEKGSSDQTEVDREIVRLRDHLYEVFWTSFKECFINSRDFPYLYANNVNKDSVFNNLFADFRGLVLSHDEDRDDKEENWGGSLVQDFIPAVTPFSKCNCAANYIFDKRAIYISTLGQQSKKILSSKRTPVKFLIYCHSRINKWELGRLVLAINSLGVLRIASIRQLKSLVLVGRIMAQLEPIVKDARSLITEHNSSAAAEKIMAANEKFNEVNRIEKAILYRVERSRYYKIQFQRMIDEIDISRITGFQPYNQFVKKRLGSSIDFIEHLGSRYQRATQNLSLLQQYFLSIAANRYAHAAEAALIVFLLPYYISSLLIELSGSAAIPYCYLVSIICTIIGGMRFFRPFNFGAYDSFLSIAFRFLAALILPSILLALPLALKGPQIIEECISPITPSSLLCYFAPKKAE